ncbi:MAG: NADPH-dependent reductase [Rhizobium sp.]|nr:NADPH-dependent reductase [Rhizobium sp.]
MRFLAISGSLRRVSTNTALLRAMASAAPDGIAVEFYDGLGELPIFNPDREGELTPQPVLDLAAKVRAADGLIISCPEYAHGIPGGLKNLLDWLVSRQEIPHKPVMLLRASSRNDISHAALQEVLRTMSVALMQETGIAVHLLGRKPDEIERILIAPEMRSSLSTALIAFANGMEEPG